MSDNANIEKTKVITVCFKETQGAEDLFIMTSGTRRKVYCRQRCDQTHIRWLSTSKWAGGYEADCPIREGIQFLIVGAEGEPLYRETVVKEIGYSDTVAVKEFDFFDDWIKKLQQEIAEKNCLLSHANWRAYLCSFLGANNREYLDNWLYCNSVETDVELKDQSSYLGNNVSLIRRSYLHTPTGRRYSRYNLESSDLVSCYAICGYQLGG